MLGPPLPKVTVPPTVYASRNAPALTFTPLHLRPAALGEVLAELQAPEVLKSAQYDSNVPTICGGRDPTMERMWPTRKVFTVW